MQGSAEFQQENHSVIKRKTEQSEALFSAPSISLFCRRTSCLWRSTGSVYYSVPAGPVFRSWIFKASWNFTPLRARISSSRFSRIWGRTPSRNAFGFAPSAWLSGTSICQPGGICRSPKEFGGRLTLLFFLEHFQDLLLIVLDCSNIE